MKPSSLTGRPARTIKSSGLPHPAARRDAPGAGRGPVLIGRFADPAAYAAWRDSIGADACGAALIRDVSFIGTASRIDDEPEPFWRRLIKLIKGR